MNLPNSLTLFRIVLVPILVVVLLTKVKNFELWGLAVLLAAALTDWLDGYLARRREQVTTLGVLLDPVADKLLIAAAFISLVELELAPAWMVVIVVGRELAVQGLRILASVEGFTVEVSGLGKAKMVLQVCAASLLILASRHPGLKSWGMAALWLVVISALSSAVLYFRKFWRNLDERIKAPGRGLLILRRQKPEQQDVAAH